MRYDIRNKWIDFVISATTGSATPSEHEASREDTAMSAPATMNQVDSALIRIVRLVLPVLMCGLVAATLYAASIGRPQQAAAEPPVQGAATGSSEQPVLPPPSTTRGHAIGDDARQETALTVLLLLAAANARARRAPEARLPGRLGSRQALDVGRVQ